MASFKHFRNSDIRIISEEVTYLMEMGYRARDREQVMEGLKVALDGSTDEEWKRWMNMKLRDVISDLHYLGTP